MIGQAIRRPCHRFAARGRRSPTARPRFRKLSLINFRVSPSLGNFSRGHRLFIKQTLRTSSTKSGGNNVRLEFDKVYFELTWSFDYLQCF